MNGLSNSLPVLAQKSGAWYVIGLFMDLAWSVVTRDLLCAWYVLLKIDWTVLDSTVVDSTVFATLLNPTSQGKRKYSASARGCRFCAVNLQLRAPSGGR